MEILQLKYFCDAARSENFTVTAKRFGVPSSAVSQSIHRLENELGTSFFFRRANSIKLNSVGKEFYSKISTSLALMDDAVASVSPNNQKKEICICIDSGRRRVLKVIEKFKASYPDIDVNIKHIFESGKDDYDIIVAGDDLPIYKYEKHLILSESLVIAIHKSNSLSSYKSLTVDMLKNESFITMNERRPMHTIVMNICADFGFTPHIALQSDDPDYVGRLVSLGMGVAIVPELYSHEFSDNVICYPIKGYARETYAYVSNRKHVASYINDFLHMLTEEKKKE